VTQDGEILELADFWSFFNRHMYHFNERELDAMEIMHSPKKMGATKQTSLLTTKRISTREARSIMVAVCIFSGGQLVQTQVCQATIDEYRDSNLWFDCLFKSFVSLCLVGCPSVLTCGLERMI